MSAGSHQTCATKIAVATSVMIVTTTANNLPMAISVRRSLEDEIDRLGLGAADGQVLALRAELFLPRRDGVLARREARQGKRPVLARHSAVRGREHHMPAVHPGMDVALDGNELRLLPLRVNRRRPSRSGLVPLGIHLPDRANAV